MFAWFSSRARDPKTLLSVVVGNQVKSVDEVWQAIDGRLMSRHKLTAAICLGSSAGLVILMGYA